MRLLSLDYKADSTGCLGLRKELEYIKKAMSSHHGIQIFQID